jgi:hypothetical protein
MANRAHSTNTSSKPIPAATTTRRLFLAAGSAGAVFAALGSAAAASADDDRDAELFELLAVANAALDRVIEGDRLVAEAENRVVSPPKPHKLFRLEGDVDLGLCTKTEVGEQYESQDFDRFVSLPSTRINPTNGGLYAHELLAWPEPRLRAAQIVLAHGEWGDAFDRAQEAAGVHAAERAFSDAIDDASAAAWPIAETRAETWQGVIAKASFIEHAIIADGHSSLEAFLEDDDSDLDIPNTAVVVSMIKDLLALSANGARPARAA